LEQRVALQTREIRSLLTHVRIGIFGLMGSSKRISKDYSQHLEILFEDTTLEGRSGLELLLTGTDLMQDEIDQIEQALNTCMGEAEINFQLNAHVLPTTLDRRDKQGQVHHYELTWDAVPSEDGLIAMILVTVNDVTELRKFESVARRKSVELAMVGEILGIREDEFRRFLSDARDLLQHSRKLLQSSTQNQERLGLILIDVHTLKGSARTLHLSLLTEALHFLEKNYKGKLLDADAALRLQDDLDRALLILQDYEDVAIQKLKWDADKSPMVKVKKELLEGGFLAMKRLLPNLSADDAQACKPLFHLLQIVSEVTLEQVLKNLLQNTARVAADLGKPAPRLQVHVPMISCGEAMEQLLRKILIHIIRNMMDHGIELPAERSREGKAANGLISIEAEVVADSIVLRIRDDGRGLDLNELASVHGGASDLSEPMIADLIFKEGLSTARTVTDMSGHGLGMAAVRKFVEESGGTVEVVLEPERQGSRRAFHLCVHLPLKGFTNHSHSSGSAA
ncbi:MAG: ATP-binding protein, partial [Pseudobdellovibrionaceae bacterium]|nr:ATP-binding protein [Pseudobdellovibrionaceae bacterium]